MSGSLRSHRFAAAGDSETVAVLEGGYRNGGIRWQWVVPRSRLRRYRTTQLRPCYIAVLYAHSGNGEGTMDLLERSYDAREPDMTFLRASPAFHGLQANPRFQRLIKRMNFPGS